MLKSLDVTVMERVLGGYEVDENGKRYVDPNQLPKDSTTACLSVTGIGAVTANGSPVQISSTGNTTIFIGDVKTYPGKTCPNP